MSEVRISIVVRPAGRPAERSTVKAPLGGWGGGGMEYLEKCITGVRIIHFCCSMCVQIRGGGVCLADLICRRALVLFRNIQSTQVAPPRPTYGMSVSS